MSSPAAARGRAGAGKRVANGPPAGLALVARLRGAASAAWGRRRALSRRALRWTEHGLAALGGLLLAYHLLFDVSVVSSGSMAPTLVGPGPEDGDWVLTEKLSFRLRRPRRWEVMTFNMNDGAQVMKRVVGLPGERVALEVERGPSGRPVRGAWSKGVLVYGRRVARPEALEGIEYLAIGKLFARRELAAGTATSSSATTRATRGTAATSRRSRTTLSSAGRGCASGRRPGSAS